MSQTVIHVTPIQLIRSAIERDRLHERHLLLDDPLPTTVHEATAQAETAQARIDELTDRIGNRPDAYTQWPLMAELRRAETIRDRALFLARAFSRTNSEVAA